MSRVLPTDDERWAVKMSFGKKIKRLSGKNVPTRKVCIERLTTKEQSSQKWNEGFMNFIDESKKQIISDAHDTIKKVEQWQQQTCAMFDMVKQYIAHNLQGDCHVSITKPSTKSVPKASKKGAVNKQRPKKSSVAGKNPLASAKKPSVTVKRPHVTAKSIVQKPSTSGTTKRISPPSIKHNEKNSSKENIACSVEPDVDCLPELSSECSSEQSAANVCTTAKSVNYLSMPTLAEDAEGDDNLKEFLKKPIGLTTKAMKKRHLTDSVFASATDFPMRKKARPVHSSILAMLNKRPQFIQSMSSGELTIANGPVSIVDKTNNVPKSVEKEPDPIPNFLKENSPEKDNVYAKFIQLRERMNQAKKDCQNETALIDKSDDTPSKAYPIQEQLIDQ